MRRALTLVVVLLGCTIGTIGCSGGGGGGGDTVAPRPLMMEMRLQNAAGNATLQTVGLFFDGQRLGTGTSGTASTTSPPMHATVADVAPGRHTVSAAVEAQTQSPSSYVLSGTFTYQGRTFNAASNPTSVASGGTVALEVDL